MTSEEYLAYLRTLGDLRELPEQMTSEQFLDFQKSGQVSFISGPEKVATGEKKKGPPKAHVMFAGWLVAHSTLDVIGKMTTGSEHMGIPGRQYRFDYAIPSVKLAFEYDGINIQRQDETSGHRSIAGVVNDSSKFNLAQLAGWMVIRVNAKSLDARHGAKGYAHAEAALRQKGVWRE